MLLAYNKVTGEVIPDFQSRATRETLLANAERRGLRREAVDVREVTEAQFNLQVEPYRQRAAQEREALEVSMRDRAAGVMKRLDLSAEDLAALLFFAQQALAGRPR